MRFRKYSLTLAVVLIVSFVTWYFWPRSVQLIDYNVRVGESAPNFEDSTAGIEELKEGSFVFRMPKIGPYEAAGHGIAPKSWKSIQHSYKATIPTGARITITGSIEVTEGSACPLAVRSYLTKASNGTSLNPHIGISSENVTKTTERNGAYTIVQHGPEKPGRYTIQIVDPFIRSEKKVVYVRATFRVTD